MYLLKQFEDYDNIKHWRLLAILKKKRKGQLGKTM